MPSTAMHIKPPTVRMNSRWFNSPIALLSHLQKWSYRLMGGWYWNAWCARKGILGIPRSMSAPTSTLRLFFSTFNCPGSAHAAYVMQDNVTPNPFWHNNQICGGDGNLCQNSGRHLCGPTAPCWSLSAHDGPLRLAMSHPTGTKTPKPAQQASCCWQLANAIALQLSQNLTKIN